MDFQASDKLKICDGGDYDGNLHVKLLAPCAKNTLCSNGDFEVEDDDVALLSRFTPISSSGKVEGSDKKRLFDKTDDSLHISVKKSKVSLYDDCDEYGDEEDGDPLLDRTKRLGISVDKTFSSLKKDIEFVEKSFEECKRKRREEEKRLESVKREIEECSRELVNKKTQFSCVRRINEVHKKMLGKVEGCVKDFVAKEAQLCLIEDLIGERKQELRVKEMELGQVVNNISKEREFKSQMKELVDDLLLKQKHFERRTVEIELKVKQHEGLVMEWELKEREFQGQMKELEIEKKQLDGRMKKLESDKKHLESRLEEFESKEKKFKEQMKESKSKEEKFKDQVKVFESKEEEIKSRVKEFNSKEKQFESKIEAFKSKEKQFESKIEDFKSKEKQFESKIEDFKSKEKQFEERWKALESKEKQSEAQVKNPESKLNKHEEKESATSYMYDESSPPIDETSLQLVSCEQSDILAILRESSDPAKLVLNIIWNPILTLYDKKGDNDVIIDDRCIYLLENLMKISPNIKPPVREEAMKLALDLKESMKENTENSLAVLGFLLILSIYGLVTSFDEDELLDLFASVAQHKIALELFRLLSFAN